MKRTHLVFPVAVLCIVALSLGVSVIVRRVHAANGAQVSRRVSSWVPNQITYKSYNNRPAWPRPVLSGEMVRAVRSDGSSVESSVLYRLDRSIDSQYRLLSLAWGIRVLTHEQLRLMTATKDPAYDNARARQQLAPALSCAGSLGGDRPPQGTVVTQETLFGYETYKVVIDMKRSRIAFWRAPGLGCAELRMLSEIFDWNTGQLIESMDRKAVDIRPGEPDPTLFDLPQGFRNVSPSEAGAARAEACCKAKLKDTELAALQPVDEQFQKYRYDW